MEGPLINPHKLFDLQFKPQLPEEDIEMYLALDGMSYTSLKDLLPESPSSGSSSWKEIPIKDPLLQHAAWAYLQPMGEAREEVERRRRWWWWRRRRLGGNCSGVLGCLNAVILVMFKGLFGEPVGKGDEDKS